MKKLSVLSLFIVLALVIVQLKKSRCREDEFTNCKVSKDAYEGIGIGADLSKVKKVLGEKNMSPINPMMISTCERADSGLTWVSRKGKFPDKAVILIGFRDNKSVCKSFILAERP